MFELHHGLFERTTFDAHEILDRHFDIGKENLAEMSVVHHVANRPDFNAGGFRR